MENARFYPYTALSREVDISKYKESEWIQPKTLKRRLQPVKWECSICQVIFHSGMLYLPCFPVIDGAATERTKWRCCIKGLAFFDHIFNLVLLKVSCYIR
jgi:hypothetical protein